MNSYLLIIYQHIIQNIKKYINPDVDYELIDENPYNLKLITRQTEDLCLYAVKQNGLALCFVKNQTPRICLEAVRQNPNAVRYVKYPSSEYVSYIV